MEEEPELLPGLRTHAWSGGVDGRVEKPINMTYPTNHNVLMRMGHINTNCTATLVGRRLVLSAAHCMIGSSGAVPTGIIYAPRRDQTTTPWGTESNEAGWLSPSYIANNCHITYNVSTRETCGKYDWVLLRLPSGAWPAGTPGFMGYWVPATSGWTSRTDGYALCGDADSPSPGGAACVPQRAYGQNAGMNTFNHRGVVAGETTVYNTSNDTSRGHSGAAIWSSTYPDSSGPYVLGVVTNHMCGTCNEPGISPDDKTYPTMVFRMTSSLAGTITNLRTTYP